MAMAGAEDSFSVGDIRRHGAGPMPFSSWKLHSGDPATAPLDTHLTSLWRRLEPIRQRILALPKHMTGSVQFVATFETRNEPVILSGGHFATAGYYALNIDFDFYFLDGFGDPALDFPYWKW